MSVNVQRTDLYVGLFLVTMVVLVLAALVATSGWGTDRYDIFVRTGSAQDLTVDTKIFLQGLEVGRITAINPRPTGRAGQLEFILRLSLLDRFPDGTPLRLPRGTSSECSPTAAGPSRRPTPSASRAAARRSTPSGPWRATSRARSRRRCSRPPAR